MLLNIVNDLISKIITNSFEIHSFENYKSQKNVSAEKELQKRKQI